MRPSFNRSSERVDFRHLRDAVEALFRAVGTPHDIASTVGEVLVNANLAGYDSHGVLHVPRYLEQAAGGTVVADARPVVLKEGGGSALLDAARGWGAYGARESMSLAVKKARANGVGVVSLANSRHIGRLGQYVEDAAADGMISMVSFGEGAPGRHLAAPFGSTRRALSTNPVAFGVPTGDDAPFVLDYATTGIANAKAWVLHDQGKPLPPGCALDKNGIGTTDPAAYLDGGSLVIFGGHKGYALSLLTCLLGGLNGAFDLAAHSMGGPFFLALDVNAFQPILDYQRAVRDFLDAMRALPPAPGFDRVLVPGDYERQCRKERREYGIPLPQVVRAELGGWARQLGLNLDL